jgi:hypothetical protein
LLLKQSLVFFLYSTGTFHYRLGKKSANSWPIEPEPNAIAKRLAVLRKVQVTLCSHVIPFPNHLCLGAKPQTML